MRDVSVLILLLLLFVHKIHRWWFALFICGAGDEFEAVSITEYSQPPELPDVMKPHPQAGTPSTKTE